MHQSKLAWLSALVAVQVVLAVPQGSLTTPDVVQPVDPALKNIPPHVRERWYRCSDKPGSPTGSSSLPCSREINIEASIRAKTLGDSLEAVKMQRYRDALLDDASGYKAAQECCFKCKAANGIHSEAESALWRDFYSEEKTKEWSQKVDQAASKNGTVESRWAFLQSRANLSPYPATITPEKQAESDKALTEEQYCPGAPKSAPELFQSNEIFQTPIGLVTFLVEASLSASASVNASVVTAERYCAPCLAVGKVGDMRTVCGAPVKDIVQVTLERTPATEEHISKPKDCLTCPEAQTAPAGEVLEKCLAVPAKKADPALKAVVEVETHNEIALTAAINMVMSNSHPPSAPSKVVSQLALPLRRSPKPRQRPSPKWGRRPLPTTTRTSSARGGSRKLMDGFI
ncbi:hypothetical protein XA68_11728 [Ophiocordyceps unilateralis]|uniref:Uncharacterized protein n=1 Tax=Ophiocordyceps unilateralis TaxID=268505 RepID=A0A2A9PG63_OPHUN|nr:hypothetical protein XA68_11728 [Ophiocordyceps unilateralis]